MKTVRNLKKCRICGSKRLYNFLDLGSMPIPNGFLHKEQLKEEEEKFPLGCFYCEDCHLVQLTNVVDPNIMFKNYVYIPSTAKVMMNNFSNLTYYAFSQKKLKPTSLVIDIGSNDGSLLTFFKSYGVKVLGIDPAENLAKVAEMKGVPTHVALFDSKVANDVVKKYGKAKVITATNVIAHIDDSNELIKGVNILLEDDGIFISEFPYLMDLIEKNQFDTIYHEHLSLISLKPWKSLVENHGLEIVDVQRLLIHGGSIRIIHKKRKNKIKLSNSVEHLIHLEEQKGLHSREAFDLFAQRVENLRKELRDTLSVIKRDKKSIVGYGAAAKGNVLTNVFNIGKGVLDYIVDSTPYKHGLYTPGKHIPVYPEHKLLADMPDYALILAWNFADEIMEKQKEYKKRGGKFIVPIPKVKII
jgi:SAM-dependent methyltransferase